MTLLGLLAVATSSSAGIQAAFSIFTIEWSARHITIVCYIKNKEFETMLSI